MILKINSRFRLMTPVTLCSIYLSLAVSVSGQYAIPFDSLHWSLDRAKISQHLGRESATGALALRDLIFTNGIIEVDIATVPGVRAYPGILFRKQNGSAYERIYIRPHRGGFYDDALQYAPVFNGADSWQFYGGPGCAAGLEIPSERWNHLKIVVSGEQANVYWNHSAEPSLVIGKLEHGRSSGTVELVSTAPGKVFFSGFSILASDTVALPPVVLSEPVCGTIRDWELSAPYSLVKAGLNTWPGSAFLAGLSWKKVTADAKGVVDISRHHTRSSPVGDCIMARTTIRAGKDTVLRLGFGYSDIITIYLNRVPVFSGNSAYQSRDGSFLGMVGYNDVLFLSLKKGENELALQLVETSGGWGYCFRYEDDVCLHASLKKAFSLKEGVSFPEAIVYDEREKVCYVANYFRDGKESISVISPDGKLLKSDWITGLQRPTGMCLAGRTLYSVDRTGLNVIDIPKGSIREKIPLTGMAMPNDVTIDQNGVVYISDTRNNQVARLADGKPEVWLGPDAVESPNALMADGDLLLVGQNRKLLAVSIPEGKVSILAEFGPESNIDGIQSDGKGNYLVSDYHGTLYRVTPAGHKEVLMNTANTGDNIADFVYIPALKMIVIPTLLGNSVTGYTLKDTD